LCKKLTGNEEQISAMAKPTNQVKNVTITQPHTTPTGPAYIRLLPYKGTMPVNSVTVENVMAKHLNNVCTDTSTTMHQPQITNFICRKSAKSFTTLDCMQGTNRISSASSIVRASPAVLSM
jgi:hypothetical protein